MITIKDVARRAGVSISTVSHVINGTKHVSDETADKVNRAIKELNYKTNIFAKNLKSQETKRIGVVVLDMCGLFFPYVTREIFRIASDNGYGITIYDTNGDFEQEKAAIRDLADNYVDGIILSSTVHMDQKEEYAKWLHQLLDNGPKSIPLVMLERDFSSYGFDSINTNTYIGAINAMQHLIDSGCRHIAHIRFPREKEGRYRAFCDVLENNHIPLDMNYVEPGDLSHISGYNCMKKLFQKKIPIDGLFTVNDQTAVGAIRAIQEEGYRIPQDIKVIGFDNVFICSNLNPPLSSVHLDKNELGARAIHALLARIQGTAPEEPIKDTLDSYLVVRTSTDLNAPPVNNW